MSSKPYKILIVEDNQVNLELFNDLLTANGYECLCTTKGEDALDIARREIPDLVLLDIELPGMDGLTALKAIRSHDGTRHLKVIALTAHAMRGDKEMFLEEGFDGYISKPVKINDFLEAVKGYLD